MPPVVRSAGELLRRPGGWVPAMVVAAGGSLGVLLPLFELPGLELGLLVAALCALLGGWTGAAAAEDLRKVPRPASPAFHRPARASPRRGPSAPRPSCSGERPRSPSSPPCSGPCSPAGATRSPRLPSFRCWCCPRPYSPQRRARSAAPRSPSAAAPSRSTSCSSSPRSRGRCGRWCSGRRCSPSTSSWGCSLARSTTRRCVLPASLLWFQLETVLWALALGTCAAAVFPAPGPAHARHRTRVLGTLVVLALCITLLEANAVRLGFRSSDAAVRSVLGGRTETEHADILYPREKSPEEVERLRRDVEFRLAQLGRFFGAPPPAVRVLVFRSPGREAALGRRGRHAVREAVARERAISTTRRSPTPRSSTSWPTSPPAPSGAGRSGSPRAGECR